MRLSEPLGYWLLSLVVVLLIGSSQVGFAQAPQPKSGAAKKESAEVPGRTTWHLTLSKTQPIKLTLQATKAPVAEIAAQLSRDLKIPVELSQLIKTHQVTVKFKDVLLEEALAELAPQAYVDYALSSEAGEQRQYSRIYLGAVNEYLAFAPEEDLIQSTLIEGDTEDETVTSESLARQRAEQEMAAIQEQIDEGQPVLKVAMQAGYLTLRVRQQPLAVVLHEVASRMGVPFKLGISDAGDLVNLDLYNVSLEQLIASLPAGVRLHVRENLQTGEQRPLRVALEPVKPANNE